MGEEWKWFRYDEIFDIKKGKRLTKTDMAAGTINFIGATDSNNGVTAKIGNAEHVHEGNKITLSYNGSIAEAFYQPDPFWAADDVNVLSLRHHTLNVYIAMFLITLIRQEKYRFNYGRKWDMDLMQSSMIKLPVKSDGTPDWKVMEKYIVQNIIPKLPSKAKMVWRGCFDVNPLKEGGISLKDRKWHWFEFGSIIYNPTKGKAYNFNTLTECSAGFEKSLRYITRTDTNNGCKCFVVDEDFYGIEEGNAITIGDTTASIFYQDKPFLCGDHIVVIRAKWLNKYTGLFVTTLLCREKYRYSYGRSLKIENIKSTIIKLPAMTNEEGYSVPDWQFIEDYIKSLPYTSNI